jgi:hypothetical protein
MIRHIRELANQAGFDASSNFIIPKHSGHISDELLKFAELIVNECIDIVIRSDQSTKMVLHEPFRTIADNIQNHFYGEE